MEGVSTGSSRRGAESQYLIDSSSLLDQPLLESILREVIIAIQRAHVHASEAGGQPIGGIVAI
jgi:hypothetical protein